MTFALLLLALLLIAMVLVSTESDSRFDDNLYWDVDKGPPAQIALHNFHQTRPQVPLFNFEPTPPQVPLFNFWRGK